MNANFATSLLQHLDNGDLKIGKAPQSVNNWIEGLGLKMNLRRFLQWHWPQKESQIGPVTILPSKALQKQEYVDELLQHQILAIGFALNGDIFVIDFSVDNCPVGFINHERYFGEGDPRTYLRLAARSIESFLFRVAENRYFPCDYYSAGHYNDFLRDEALHDPFPPYRPSGSNSPAPLIVQAK